MSLSSIVALYRKGGRPAFDGGLIELTFDFDAEVSGLLSSISSETIVRELLVDGQPIEQASQIPATWSQLEVTIRPPTGSSDRIYEGIDALVSECQTLHRGIMPSDFFLVNSDYLHSEGVDDESITKLSKLCKFIEALSRIANYHDSRVGGDTFNLVFMSQDDGRNHSLSFATKILPDLLDCDISIDELSCINERSERTESHFLEQKILFRESLIEFSNNSAEGDFFLYLVQNWADFLALFEGNLGSYLSGFALSKSKKEIAEAELDLGAKCSNVVSEITGKLLGLPVSLASIPLIITSDSLTVSLLLVFAIVLASFIIAALVANQQAQLVSIKHAKELICSRLSTNALALPESLESHYVRMDRGLTRSINKLSYTLIFFRGLCWLIPFVGLWAFYLRTIE